MPDNALFKRLKALIVFRAFFVTFLLGTFLFFGIGFYKFPYTHTILYFIIIPLYILSVVYGLFLPRIRNLVIFAHLQLFADAISSVSLIFLTGGIESWFSFIMLLIVIGSVITVNRKAGYITATICSILYGLMIDLQFYHLIPVPYDPSVMEKDFLYNIFSHISGLYLTAYLTGYLSSRLEKTSKKLEEKDSNLKDLTFFHKELIESLPSGLLTTDLSGSILIFNRAAEHITGVLRTAAIGNNITTVFPFVIPPIETLRGEGMITVHGTRRTIGLTLSQSTDSSGHETGYICIFQDITDLKRLEAELKHKETLAAIGELSANMAHEIRNPLASLKGSIEILKEGTLTRAHGEKLMDIALSEMDRLNTIITDFLTYSRPKPPEFLSFDLHVMLDEIIQLTRNAIMSPDNISITKDFGGHYEIVADPQKLRQVFLNLTMNAVESMPDGGSLIIKTRRVHDTVAVSFRDSGIGIPPENLKEIFYPFFTTKDRGTGLGLSIAYRIIEEHRGRITVNSIPGTGTTFEVTIPVSQPSSGSTPEMQNSRAKGEHAGLARPF
ncbi:MAG TPA: ATP-binding protein [Thermodesulfovibrionales bacterium]|nr:ATP-binding protein [Thermodesulfovibrionales bacterium]